MALECLSNYCVFWLWQLLISTGANVDSICDQNVTALMRAAQSGHVPTVKVGIPVQHIQQEHL